jgi:hypothetical protein
MIETVSKCDDCHFQHINSLMETWCDHRAAEIREGYSRQIETAPDDPPPYWCPLRDEFVVTCLEGDEPFAALVELMRQAKNALMDEDWHGGHSEIISSLRENIDRLERDDGYCEAIDAAIKAAQEADKESE